jgi:predicted metal-dependent enzyme (double-stranded beta helix superfamily)
MVPLLVKDTEHLTMDLIASGNHLPKTNLSIVAQKLYDCISGKKFLLDSPEFPEFSKAIEHSIKTPGKWCYERLKQKATEFDKDKPNEKETYLRITLGENNGESPGIPYVMEIWPVGHYSPIHNHAGASAIIRVLRGSIHVSLFPFLSGDEVEPFAKADFKQGDITWISPALNQVHQLHNLDSNKDTCITIQCYMYKNDNTSHYDYFDYVDADGKTQQYEPDSDMEFLAFKALMRKEYLEVLPKPSWRCF